MASPASARNSARVRGSSRTSPCSAEVTVVAPGFCTPRIDMHMVLGLEHDADALRRELALQPAGDLRGQPLLDLQRAGEVVDHPRELGQPDDPLAGQVADVGDAENGSRWCSHSEWNGMSRATTSSS